jgi:hypothetical protein
MVHKFSNVLSEMHETDTKKYVQMYLYTASEMHSASDKFHKQI